ncbi:hypothetical protein N7I30_21195 [Aurantimonas litoralis]|nr:hypothetical protein [Aurantimonas litoralis]
MNEEQLLTFQRLLAIAEGDTGSSKRVENFLLAWWNPVRCGGFHLTELWQLDEGICNDIETVIGFISRRALHPGDIYADRMKSLVERWRPEIFKIDRQA